MEKFKEDNPHKGLDMKKVAKVVTTLGERMNDFQFEVVKPSILSNLPSLGSLNTEHPAKKYILNRKLPLEDLYWADDFCEYVNSVRPNTFSDSKNNEGRIIIPFTDKEGNCFGFQGRAIHNTNLRYITILLEEKPKVFGLNKLNYEQRIFITEGPFDSLLLRNACAMGGADISDYRHILGDNIVFVYDNEPRNRQIMSRVEEHIRRGESVVIWPSHIKEKDINDMQLAGLDVQFIVDTNTYSGLTATLKLKEWRK